MTSAIVTGATSFIGHMLVCELLHRGQQVYALVRPGSEHISILADCPEIQIIWKDIEDITETDALGVRGDVFYHMAWMGVGGLGRSNETLQQRNVEVAVNCLRLAKQAGCCKFLFAGSQAEYGALEGVQSEDLPCYPISPYGKAKLEVLHQSLELARELSIQYIHTRIFSVYGPNDHSWTLVSQCVEKFSRGLTVELSEADQLWNFLYVTDAAAALADLGERETEDKIPVYNVAGTDTRFLRSFIEEINVLVGGNGYPAYGALPHDRGKLISLNPDISKLQRSTGWSPRISFVQGIQNMLAYRNGDCK